MHFWWCNFSLSIFQNRAFKILSSFCSAQKPTDEEPHSMTLFISIPWNLHSSNSNSSMMVWVQLDLGWTFSLLCNALPGLHETLNKYSFLNIPHTHTYLGYGFLILSSLCFIYSFNNNMTPTMGTVLVRDCGSTKAVTSYSTFLQKIHCHTATTENLLCWFRMRLTPG